MAKESAEAKDWRTPAAWFAAVSLLAAFVGIIRNGQELIDSNEQTREQFKAELAQRKVDRATDLAEARANHAADQAEIGSLEKLAAAQGEALKGQGRTLERLSTYLLNHR
jgi:hypothetical protein